MARFLRQAIESVLSQRVPDLEYTVMDGGSDDGTVEILQSYGDRLHWRSEPDKGAADALRRGLLQSSGEILGWLNADDVLLPGALESVMRAFDEHPNAAAVFSGAWWTDESGNRFKPYPVAPDAAEKLSSECLICQPACFFRASAYRKCGGIDDTLHSAFDYDLWIRLSRAGEMIFVPGEWAESRMHRSNKSLGERKTMFQEAMAVLERQYGYVPFHWIYSELVYQADGRDQFFEELKPSLPRYALSLPAGLKRNWRHPLRYTADWAGQMSWRGLRRRLGAGRKSP